MGNFFNIDIPENFVDPVFTIGAAEGEDVFSYCLVRVTYDKGNEIVLAKTVKSKDVFEKELTALSEIFNAKIIR